MQDQEKQVDKKTLPYAMSKRNGSTGAMGRLGSTGYIKVIPETKDSQSKVKQGQ